MASEDADLGKNVCTIARTCARHGCERFACDSELTASFALPFAEGFLNGVADWIVAVHGVRVAYQIAQTCADRIVNEGGQQQE